MCRNKWIVYFTLGLLCVDGLFTITALSAHRDSDAKKPPIREAFLFGKVMTG